MYNTNNMNKWMSTNPPMQNTTNSHQQLKSEVDRYK